MNHQFTELLHIKMVVCGVIGAVVGLKCIRVECCAVQKLKKEFDALAKSQASAKKQLEDETIMRVDLENRIQSLKEELAFLSEVHKQVSHAVS